jgi:hypothetical protein
MKKNTSFRTLCKCLQDEKTSGQSSVDFYNELKKAEPDWHEVVKIADLDFMIPILYHQLDRKGAVGLLPKELQTLIYNIYQLNGQRNQQILDEITRIAAALNKVGIEPVFLKGSAALLMKLYESHELRLMNDVDFLVYREDIPTCGEILESMGYVTMDEVNRPWVPHHINPLVHHNHNFRLEVHYHPTHILPVLDTHEVIANSRTIKIGESVVRVPDEMHFLLNNIVNNYYNIRKLFFKEIPLYKLYDLYKFQGKYSQSLDWSSVLKRLKEHHLQDDLYILFGLLNDYFNQGPPADWPFFTFRRKIIYPFKKKAKRIIFPFERKARIFLSPYKRKMIILKRKLIG